MRGKNRVYNLWDGGQTPVARGGSGAKAPPLAARQKRGLQLPWDLLQTVTLRFYYVASSPSSPLPHLLDGHRKLVGCSAIPARSYPGSVQYPWGSIVKLEVSPDETPGLMTLRPHNTNVLQSITYAKSPYPPGRSNPGQKN